MRFKGFLLQNKTSALASLILEDSLDRQAEEASDLEGERETRVVLASLDGVDALAGNIETLGELRLAPAAFGA